MYYNKRRWFLFIVSVNENFEKYGGRRSSVNFGGKTFLPENYVWKINKMPEFYVIFARKIIKMSDFFHDISPKN